MLTLRHAAAAALLFRRLPPRHMPELMHGYVSRAIFRSSADADAFAARAMLLLAAADAAIRQLFDMAADIADMRHDYFSLLLRFYVVAAMLMSLMLC